VELESKAHARIWIRKNQKGRRNLNDFQRIELEVGDKADLILIGAAIRKETEGRPGKETVDNIVDSLPRHDTRATMAKNTNTSEGNVYKVEKILEQASHELLQAVRTGEVTINLASQLATLPKAKQAEVIAAGSAKVAQVAVKEIKQAEAKAKKDIRRDEINQQVAAIGRRGI
jgi:hypothetical protein